MWERGGGAGSPQPGRGGRARREGGWVYSVAPGVLCEVEKRVLVRRGAVPPKAGGGGLPHNIEIIAAFATLTLAHILGANGALC